jgi:hypothetical protein
MCPSRGTGPGAGPIAQVVHNLEISEQVISTWRRQQLIDSGELPGMISGDHAELPAVTSGLSVAASRRPYAQSRIAFVRGRGHALTGAS